MRSNHSAVGFPARYRDTQRRSSQPSLWLFLLLTAMAAGAFAGTETPPLPQGDVVLSGEGFEIGTMTFVIDGVTTTLAINATLTTVTLQEPPRVFVEYEKYERALTSEIDSLTTQIAGLNQLIAEAEALIFTKEALLVNLQDDLQSVMIEIPTITLDGPTTATLRRN